LLATLFSIVNFIVEKMISEPKEIARSQHDPVNAAEAVDAIGFHSFPLPIGGADGLYSMSSAVKDTRRV
jgi:hypothetical protein